MTPVKNKWLFLISVLDIDWKIVLQRNIKVLLSFDCEAFWWVIVILTSTYFFDGKGKYLCSSSNVTSVYFKVTAQIAREKVKSDVTLYGRSNT